MAVAGGDERKRIALRNVALQRRAQCGAAQVGRERRALPDREHARLRARMTVLRRAVAGREHERVRRRPQVLVDADEALLVARESRARRPRLRGRRDGPDRAVERNAPALRHEHAPGFDRDRGAREVQHDAALDQQPPEPCAHDRRMLLEQRGLVGDERESRRGRAQRLRQLPLHRQQHFDARRAAADDADRAHAARGRVGLDPRPRGEKARDRLDGKRVRQRARYPGVRRRADVEGNEIERLAPSRPERDRLRVRVERLDAVDDEPRTGPLRERRERDVGLDVRVVSGDEPRQHARVGRGGIGRDQRQRDCRLRLQREPAEDFDVAVAAADEQDALRARSHAPAVRRGGSAAPERPRKAASPCTAPGNARAMTHGTTGTRDADAR